MSHLELFHHFVSVLAPSIGINATIRELWVVIIPKMALKHKFLMHSLQAIAALHIAHMDPSHDRMYRDQAVAHQGEALRLAQVEMRNPNESNADALFAFSLPTMWYGFAIQVMHGDDSYQQPLLGAVQSINLLRGIKTVGPSVRQWTWKGPLAPLSKLSIESYSMAPDFSDQGIAAYFSKLLLFCSTGLSQEMELDDHENFAAAASALRAAFLRVEAVGEGGLPNTPPIWHWAIRLPFDFVTRLADLHAIPMILVAHWCVLLSKASHFWWMDGWVDKTMGEIRQCIPHEHAHWLEWPTNQIQQISGAGVSEAVGV